MINFKKFAKKNAKKIKYGVFSFSVLLFGSLATASVFFNNKKKLKKNDDHSSKNKVDLSSKSIETYGNLTSGIIKVDYDGSNYTFQINGKTVITGLAKLNTELNNQGDTEDDYTIDNLNLTFDETKTKARAKSIATYGDLKDLNNTINVSNGDDEAIKYTVNGQELNFANLKTQATKQGITLSDEEALNKTQLTGLVTSELTKANSIATYGNLRSQTINVSYGVDEAIKYTVKNNQELNFADLTTEATNQEITLTNGKNTEATLDATDLKGLNLAELTKAQTKKTNLVKAKAYFDLTDVENASFFNKADDETINLITTEINKINDYDSLIQEAKDIVDHNDNVDLKNALDSRLQELKTKKANLEAAKVYFDLTDVENASFFNKADDETINAIPTEINKINDYDSLIQEAKDIVDHNDNVDLKNALDSRLQELKTKKANLEAAKVYFDLTDVENASFFNKADDETINAIPTEINKINNYDVLSDDVKAIVDHNDNVDLKNALDSRLQELKTKKANLEATKVYFDLTDVKDPSFFNKADDETINLITTEINKINDYDSLIQKVKDIVEHNDNVDLKNALDSRLQELQTKKANLESAKTYFDLNDVKNASFFNKADEKTINAIPTEINKINVYDSLIQEVKDIVDHNDNVDLKNALDSRLKQLQTKKANLEATKTYFDLNDVKNASFFNKADEKTINAIPTEINKINVYDSLIQEVKDIVDHNDNVDLKNALDSRLQALKTKKANLEATKTYFDLTDVKNASFFNKVDDEIINAISTEIKKINNYDVLSDDVKAIVDHNDNVDLKNALDSRLQALKTKKANLEAAKTYFDLNDVKNASFFNKADEKTINAIPTEINKINVYDSLIQEVKDIVDHNDNVDLKNALDSRLQALKTKKANLESVKTYFDLNDVKNASFFNKADEKTINAIPTEINKINDYDSLIQEVKDIVDHNDNVDLKNALDSRLQQLQTKKANLEAAKTYFDLTDVKNASFFNKADEKTINAISTEIKKINVYDSLIQEVKDIVDHNDNVDLKNALDSRLQALKTKKANLEATKTYFDLNDVKNASFFNKADEKTINAIPTEINKINVYDSLIQEVKDIVDHNDNVDLKNALDSRLQQLQTKKANLESAKTYFDLNDVKNASFFNKADEKTINAIPTEIKKINDYGSLAQEVKNIVDHNDNSNLKNVLNSRLQELETKKINLEAAKVYFDLTDVENASFFNNADDETINAISTEIKKINDYGSLAQEVKNIVDHNDNSNLKNVLNSRLQELETKKINLEAAKVYFDLTDVENASFFNNADDETINAISTEINKINNYDTLIPEVKDIVDHNDNSEFKNALKTTLKSLETKKTNLAKAKTYFDLTDVQDHSIFNNADDETINAISTEINKINNYDVLSDDVKAIVDHNDNSNLKNVLNSRLQELETKKINLEAAKVYFDLTDVENASFFNNADDETINAISTEIKKINDYGSLAQEVKNIVDHNDNSNLKNVLNSRLQELETKKINLEAAKVYFDLTDVENASFFNNADDETINAISTEIKKINDYGSLAQEVKNIVDHNDNSNLKNVLNSRLQELETKKINLEAAKVYFDLTDVQDHSIFNKANEETINAISTEINKINDYDVLSDDVKAIVDHNDNSEFKNALKTTLKSLETKKANLIETKTYFDLNDVQDHSIFNKADDETINAISTEINKINNYDVLSDDVKAIIDHNDNSEFKNALETTLKSLETKKTNLAKAKTYFDLTDVQDHSIFNKADDETINAISTEINKINDYDSLIQEVKNIVNQKDNSNLKNALNSRLQKLQTKKTNLESAKTYFDLTDVKNASFFNKTDEETINEITIKINQINNYFRLLPEVKEIVNHNDNSDLKNALDTRLQALQTKKANLEEAKIYFVVKNASFFNKTNQKTINAITTQINKINSYDTLVQEVKEIVNHNDNFDLKNTLDIKLQALETKKTNLEIAKTYFDLTDVENASFFNKANDETINLITTEINKINSYDTLVQEVKEIVNHSDNSNLKNTFDIKLQELQTKKTNLVKAKTYFDLIDVKNASFFNKADEKTINLITTEINKINNYDVLLDDVKKIVNHNDNSGFKNALETTLKSLQTKKANLVKAKDYFDLTDVKNASFFNKTDDETYRKITNEIYKINDYFRLLPEVKEIVEHNDNVDLKNALDSRLQQLQTKKTNLELARIYLDLYIKDSLEFIEPTEETISLIDKEIKKDNFIFLTNDVKIIINHNDNSEFKIALTNKFNSLKDKKLLLEKAKVKAKETSIATYGDLKTKLFTSFENQEFKFNTIKKPDVKLSISELNTQYFLQYDFDLELENLLDVKKEEEEWGTLIIDEDSFLKSLTKAYFVSNDIQTFFNKANDQTIAKITTEINKINNFNSLSEKMKEFVTRFNSYKSKNYLYIKLKEKKANLIKAKAYLDLNIKDSSIFNNATEKEIELINKEIDKDIFATLSQEVQEIINHHDNLTKKNVLINKFNSLKTKKANLVKAKTYLDLSNIEKPSFFNNVDQTKIRAIENEKNKISQQNNFSKEEKKIINHSDNLFLKVALFQRLKKLQIKKANLIKAKAYLDLNIKDSSLFNNASERGIELITKEINKDNFAIISQEVKEIINHNDNSDLKNALDTRLQALKTKKANLEIAKAYLNLNIKDPSLFNRATAKGIELITKEINKDTFGSLSREVKTIINYHYNLIKKNALTNKFNALKTKKANLEKAKIYFDYFEPKLAFFNSNFEFLAKRIKEKLLTTKLSPEIKEIINHNDNSDLKKKWLIGFENFKLHWSNLSILNVLKNKNILIKFREKYSEIFQIFLDPYKVFNENIEATIEKQNNLALKHYLQKEFSAYKKSQKKNLRIISILKNGDLSRHILFVDYINHQFVFKKHYKVDPNFVIYGIKPLVRILILQSIVKSPFYPLTPEQFEEKLINSFESNKQIFFANWTQAKRKWALDFNKKTFIQSNNHLLNWHSQNNLFLHPSFILAFFVIIFCVDRFVKWIKRLWKN